MEIKRNKTVILVPITYSNRMTLICFQFTMIRELYVNSASTHLWRTVVKACDHSGGRHLIGHFQKCLIFALQHEHICYAAEWNAQLDHLSFARLVWYVSDVYHP